MGFRRLKVKERKIQGLIGKDLRRLQRAAEAVANHRPELWDPPECPGEVPCYAIPRSVAFRTRMWTLFLELDAFFQAYLFRIDSEWQEKRNAGRNTVENNASCQPDDA